MVIEMQYGYNMSKAEWLQPYHWKPGQSGNPAGRPPGIKYISEIAHELLADEGIQKQIADQIRRNIETELDALPLAKFLEFIRDTTEGKPKITVAAETKMDLAITLDADIPVKEITEQSDVRAGGEQLPRSPEDKLGESVGDYKAST